MGSIERRKKAHHKTRGFKSKLLSYAIIWLWFVFHLDVFVLSVMRVFGFCAALQFISFQYQPSKHLLHNK